MNDGALFSNACASIFQVALLEKKMHAGG